MLIVDISGVAGIDLDGLHLDFFETMDAQKYG